MPPPILTPRMPTSAIRAGCGQTDSEDLTCPCVEIKKMVFSGCARLLIRVLSNKCWLPLDITILYQRQNSYCHFICGERKDPLLFMKSRFIQGPDFLCYCSVWFFVYFYFSMGMSIYLVFLNKKKILEQN